MAQRNTPRARHEVNPLFLKLLAPAFRRSQTRDGAYILRGVGGQRGPVLVARGVRRETGARPVD